MRPSFFFVKSKTERDQQKGYGTLVLLVLNILNAAFPYIQLFGFNEPYDRKAPWVMAFMISSTVINIIYFNVIYLFLRLSLETTDKHLKFAEYLNSFMRLFDEDLLPVLKFKDNDADNNNDIRNSSVSITTYLDRNSASQSFRESLVSMFQNTEKQQSSAGRKHRNSGKSGALASLGDGNSIEAMEKNLDGSKKFTVSGDVHEANILGVMKDYDQAENPIPMLNLHHPENIMTWFYCQRLFTRYGERTRARLEFNILLLVAIVFILMASVIAYLASTETKTSVTSVFYK